MRFDDFRKLPGPQSWLGFDLGYEPSLWSIDFAAAAAKISGSTISSDEWAFLNQATTGLNEARAWLAEKDRQRRADLKAGVL